jgi:hypothetical protein
MPPAEILEISRCSPQSAATKLRQLFLAALEGANVGERRSFVIANAFFPCRYAVQFCRGEFSSLEKKRRIEGQSVPESAKTLTVGKNGFRASMEFSDFPLGNRTRFLSSGSRRRDSGCHAGRGSPRAPCCRGAHCPTVSVRASVVVIIRVCSRRMRLVRLLNKGQHDEGHFLSLRGRGDEDARGQVLLVPWGSSHKQPRAR